MCSELGWICDTLCAGYDEAQFLHGHDSSLDAPPPQLHVAAYAQHLVSPRPASWDDGCSRPTDSFCTTAVAVSASSSQQWAIARPRCFHSADQRNPDPTIRAWPSRPAAQPQPPSWDDKAGSTSRRIRPCISCRRRVQHRQRADMQLF
jgi:hypothetical protein